MPPHLKNTERSTQPVTGSRKRKARKHSVTHLTPVANGNHGTTTTTATVTNGNTSFGYHDIKGAGALISTVGNSNGEGEAFANRDINRTEMHEAENMVVQDAISETQDKEGMEEKRTDLTENRVGEVNCDINRTEMPEAKQLAFQNAVFETKDTERTEINGREFTDIREEMVNCDAHRTEIHMVENVERGLSESRTIIYGASANDFTKGGDIEGFSDMLGVVSCDKKPAQGVVSEDNLPEKGDNTIKENYSIRIGEKSCEIDAKFGANYVSNGDKELKGDNCEFGICDGDAIVSKVCDRTEVKTEESVLSENIIDTKPDGNTKSLYGDSEILLKESAVEASLTNTSLQEGAVMPRTFSNSFEMVPKELSTEIEKDKIDEVLSASLRIHDRHESQNASEQANCDKQHSLENTKSESWNASDKQNMANDSVKINMDSETNSQILAESTTKSDLESESDSVVCSMGQESGLCSSGESCGIISLQIRPGSTTVSGSDPTMVQSVPTTSYQLGYVNS